MPGTSAPHPSLAACPRLLLDAILSNTEAGMTHHQDLAYLDEARRAEYWHLSDVSKSDFDPASKRVLAWTFVLLIVVTGGGAAWIFGTRDFSDSTALWLDGMWMATLFGGLGTAAVINGRVKRRARASMRTLLADAKSERVVRDADPPTSAETSRHYLVTGTYDPALYRQRGGRATADAMRAWGYDDYATYEANRPD